MTVSQKMFEKGKPIKNLHELVLWLECDSWVYLRNVPKHPSILESMTLRTLRMFVRGGMVFRALPTVGAIRKRLDFAKAKMKEHTGNEPNVVVAGAAVAVNRNFRTAARQAGLRVKTSGTPRIHKKPRKKK